MMKNRRKKIKPFYNPPHLLLKQMVMVLLYAVLVGWNKKAFLQWLLQGKNLIHAGAGAKQICCFGLNPHVVWEMTSRCNLKCIHCHAFGGDASYAEDELSKEEGMALIDQIASSDIRSFVFTGGEPLLREDLFDLIEYAKSMGFTVFIATNGTLITKEVAKLLREFDVGVVIGLDAMNPEIHDRIRGVEGAFDAVIEGIENCIAENLYLHLNIVASRPNFDEIERIIDFGTEIGVYSYFIYRFVPFGRGEEIRDYELGRGDFKAFLDLILEKQREVRAIIIPVASPEYWAYVLQKRGIHSRRIINFLGRFFGGCLAGKGMMYIKPNGDVWACPFLPVHVGNVRKERIDRIWENLEKFGYEYTNAGGNSDCNGCEYAPVCGGCKTREEDWGCPLRR
ncbi:MAG: radical SAM protein [Methanophagales archaeon]|nr:radical SAM protein [Methanophagales archaeon]